MKAALSTPPVPRSVRQGQSVPSPAMERSKRRRHAPDRRTARTRLPARCRAQAPLFARAQRGPGQLYPRLLDDERPRFPSVAGSVAAAVAGLALVFAACSGTAGLQVHDAQHDWGWAPLRADGTGHAPHERVASRTAGGRAARRRLDRRLGHGHQQPCQRLLVDRACRTTASMPGQMLDDAASAETWPRTPNSPDRGISFGPVPDASSSPAGPLPGLFSVLAEDRAASEPTTNGLLTLRQAVVLGTLEAVLTAGADLVPTTPA